MKRIVLAGLCCAAALAAVQTAFACPNCYGDPQSSMTEGMNMAIVSLLGITGGVLGGVVAFFLYLRRRIRMLNHRFADRLN